MNRCECGWCRAGSHYQATRYGKERQYTSYGDVAWPNVWETNTKNRSKRRYNYQFQKLNGYRTPPSSQLRI